MNEYEHLRLPLYQDNLPRQKGGSGGGFTIPEGRDKSQFSQQSVRKTDVLVKNFSALKNRFSDRIDPSLIFEIEINQSVYPDGFENELSSMGIKVLSVAEGRKGFWVVLSSDKELRAFRRKLETYGSERGPKYDFFHAIKSFRDIPMEKKIGKQLADNPLGDTADFIDLELWRIENPEEFINQLKKSYELRITDQLITKSFVLLRLKLSKSVFDAIIQLKEIARADRLAMLQLNPSEITRLDVSNMQFSAPEGDAAGILVIDSGIISNHPMLEKCVGAEENYQENENEVQDTVGHGTGVAGCAVYGDIQEQLDKKSFTPSNWLFSAKVMYAKRNEITGVESAVYDKEKLFEHQLKDAVEGFLSNSAYNIKVVNISLGNVHEIWHKSYTRQLPLAALIDELAFTFSQTVFIVSTGNQSPQNIYNSIAEIKDNYPRYLIENDSFKIINPATSALALSIGSIASEVKRKEERFGEEQIKMPIAEAHQPSPFTRTGFGVNGMLKPELVEYGGNLILSEKYGRITEDATGKLALLNNAVVDNIIKFDVGTSFVAPKVAHLAGKIANTFPNKSADFIKNMLLVGAKYPFLPAKDFYGVRQKEEITKKNHLSVCGYGLSHYEKARYSYDNRAVLWDEGEIGLNQIKVYSLDLPALFFTEEGRKNIIVTLTFTPETRSTRGDSYLGNRMEFHLFHSVKPEELIDKYGVIENDTEKGNVPNDLKGFEIKFFPGANIRKAGCHQKAWKTYKKRPQSPPKSPISLVLLNLDKWIRNESRMQNYCISVIFEHTKEIDIYHALRTNIQQRTRLR